MNTEKEAVIKVKFDDYKMVSNFLKNDLGITKEMITSMLKEMINKVDIERLIIQKIERFVGKNSGQWRFVIEKTLRSEIEMIVREQVRQKMKDFQ